MPTTPQDIVQRYLDWHYPVVTWPQIGDLKGPTDKDWPQKNRLTTGYKENFRYGLLLGVEVAPSAYLTDVDIDWAPGTHLAQSLLPPTEFLFGHGTKQISHCFYTTNEALASYAYLDVDKTMLIELRGTNKDGSLGHQTMVPPSVWTKNGKIEPLVFVRDGPPVHIEAAVLKQRVIYAAVAMLLAKHFGVHGFGHEVRLLWAGFLLRAGIGIEDLARMGHAISIYCDNREVEDIRWVLKSTAENLHKEKKVRGGPALAKHLGPSGKAIVTLIQEWLGKTGDFVRNASGAILPKHHDNVRRAVELLGHELAYNEFADVLLIDGKKMEDREVNSVLTYIEIEHHFQPPEQYFERTIKFLAWQNPFHPVKDYLNRLTWDGEPRIDEWLVRAGDVEDTAYARAVSSILLIAGVRRIRQPGCKYDEMVVWESPTQGTDKSSAAQALCPNPKWFSDDLRLNLHAQQLIESTLGKWIIEASDLAGKRKTEIEQLKAMLSRQVDGPARLAYAHFSVERPRHFILIGTTNSSAYLTDQTGARRFWPLLIRRRFDVEWIRTNRDQLWAEACVREARGESIRLHEDLWPEAAAHQEARREIDPWEASIREAALREPPSGDDRRRITAESVWSAVGVPLERRDRAASLRITEIMQRLGFRRTRVRPSGGEVQIGFVQEVMDLLEMPEGQSMRGRDPGEDDTPF